MKKKSDKTIIEYNLASELRKSVIKSESNKAMRALKWLHYFIIFPFKRIWYNARDYRVVVCFIISFLIVSSSVWVFYLIALISGLSSPLGITMLGIGSAVWARWLGGASPFTLIVILLTIGLKMLLNKIGLILSKKNKKI